MVNAINARYWFGCDLLAEKPAIHWHLGAYKPVKASVVWLQCHYTLDGAAQACLQGMRWHTTLSAFGTASACLNQQNHLAKVSQFGDWALSVC